MKSSQEILIEEARRFRGNAKSGDKCRREAYKVIAYQLEKGIGMKPRAVENFKVCSKCGVRIEKHIPYCAYCGQAINWEERND